MKYLGQINDPKDIITKEYVDHAIKGVNSKIDEKANTSDLFGISSFKWTDYTYTATNEFSSIWDDGISIESGSLTIDCTGDTLGFTAVTGEGVNDVIMEVNGQNIILTANTPYTLEPTTFTNSLTFTGSLVSISCTNMTKSGFKEDLVKIPTELKNPKSLSISRNGTSLFNYDGSEAKSLNLKSGSNIQLASDTSGEISISAVHTHDLVSLGTNSNLSGIEIRCSSFDGSSEPTTKTSYRDETAIEERYVFPNSQYYSDFSIFTAGDKVSLLFEGNCSIIVNGSSIYVDGSYTMPVTTLTAPISVSTEFGHTVYVTVTYAQPRTNGFMSAEDKETLQDLQASLGDIDTELSDIRLAEDGTQYNTAGNAIRGQIGKLKSDLADLDKSIKMTDDGNGNVTMYI